MRSNRALSLLMILFAGYFFAPVIYWFWLEHEQSVGAFQTGADSIGIPFAGFMVIWFLGLVIVLSAFFALTVSKVLGGK